MFILMLCILTFLTLTWFNFITGILFTEQYISCISFFLPSRPKRCKYKVNYKCFIIFCGGPFLLIICIVWHTKNTCIENISYLKVSV